MQSVILTIRPPLWHDACRRTGKTEKKRIFACFWHNIVIFWSYSYSFESYKGGIFVTVNVTRHKQNYFY